MERELEREWRALHEPSPGDVVGTCEGPGCSEPIRKPRQGPIGRFCDPKCKAAWHHQLSREAATAAKAGRRCEFCDSLIPVDRSNGARFCGDPTCEGKRRYQVVKANPAQLARAQESSRAAQAKRYAELSEPGRAVRSIRARANEGARLVKAAGGIAEDVDLLRDVILAHGLRCHICRGRTALVLSEHGRPGPLAVTFDHVVPIANGGSHTVENIRPAHLRCNTLKQDRGIEWARAKSGRIDAPAPTVAQLHAMFGALALTSDGIGVLHDSESNG